MQGKKRPFMQTVSLFGIWKFGRKGGISFRIDYGEGEVRAINFGTQFYLTKRDKIVFELQDKTGQSLGISVTFSRRFLMSRAETFLGFEKNERESKITAGVKIPR